MAAGEDDMETNIQVGVCVSVCLWVGGWGVVVWGWGWAVGWVCGVGGLRAGVGGRALGAWGGAGVLATRQVVRRPRLAATGGFKPAWATHSHRDTSRPHPAPAPGV